MPAVNPEILTWARETAGLSPERAAKQLGFKDSTKRTAEERLAALEAGTEEPTSALLLKMAKQYRRPLVAFYLTKPPTKGERGEDYRTLPSPADHANDASVDALVRSVRARQSLVRSILEDDEEPAPLPFVASARREDGVQAVAKAIASTVGITTALLRSQKSPDAVFDLLRRQAEGAGIYVLLIGNLGSHQTAFDVKAFRGFALADPIAPFVIINDQDAKAAWCFTLLHELAHLWIGATGLSGERASTPVERFCNDVAGEILLPGPELAALAVEPGTDFQVADRLISAFANDRHLSRSMIAYKLYRNGGLSEATWSQLAAGFRAQWLASREREREQARAKDSGPDYYVVRRHRVGAALLGLVKRALLDGSLSVVKAATVLGVKPTNVQTLVSG